MVCAFERIFAKELTESDLIITKNGYGRCLISPTGALCTEIFLCGTLTEIQSLSKEKKRLRFTDSTGVLLLDCTQCPKEELELIERLPVPSFISVTGSPALYKRRKEEIILIDAFTIKNISRQIRDMWTIRTAITSLKRIKELDIVISGKNSIIGKSDFITHYSIKQKDLLMYLQMTKKALQSVKEIRIIEKIDPKKFLLSIISEKGGKKGVELKELLDLARIEGINEDEVLSNIGFLITEDEIYQPQKGLLKIL